MLSARLTRQFALVTGAVAIVGMGALSACSTTKDKEKPARPHTNPSLLVVEDPKYFILAS